MFQLLMQYDFKVLLSFSSLKVKIGFITGKDMYRYLDIGTKENVLTIDKCIYVEDFVECL
jgi:hypothetical protein